jgi:ATP-dependent DNA ligase
LWAAGHRDTAPARTFGALLVGAHDHVGQLVYLGKVGTGFTQTMLRHIADQLADLEQPTSAFDTPGALWRRAWGAVGPPGHRGCC